MYNVYLFLIFCIVFTFLNYYIVVKLNSKKIANKSYELSIFLQIIFSFIIFGIIWGNILGGNYILNMFGIKKTLFLEYIIIIFILINIYINVKIR